jgi:hopanoid biosynthesis associated protein HpnK
MGARRSVPPIQVIVNADDFGRSASINAAIVEAYERGILTSCSLMVAEPAAVAAADAARERPGLAVGLHVVVVGGHTALPGSVVPRLTRGTGRLPDDPVRTGLRYAFDPRVRDELTRELQAQFQRFESLRLPMSHVDGHLHMHMHPFVFDRALELAEASGCRRIRIPHDDWWGHRRAAGVGALSQVPLALIFALLARRARRRAAARGFVWADRVHGLFQTDRMNERALVSLLERLPPGSHEIYSHPDAGGRGAAGKDELAALLSPTARRLLDERGICRIRYPDLEKSACN